MQTVPTRRSLQLAVLAVVASVAVAGCGGGSSPSAQASAARRAQVEARGTKVMPFDQNRTIHVFHKTATGGVQTVVAKQVDDRRQIGLVRSHLRKEAKRFAAGDFSDPMAIHGMRMPGLSTLRAGASRIRVAYTTVTGGARITYTTEDPKLVDGLHEWFDAQLMDHGAHAQG